MTEWLQRNQRPSAALPLGVLDQMIGTLYVPPHALELDAQPAGAAQLAAEVVAVDRAVDETPAAARPP